MSVDDGAPFGGLDSQPTSRLTTPAAIGVGVGVVVFIILVAGLGFCFWSRRGGRKPLPVVVHPPRFSRHRSASNATDQKTLVASLPNSPQHPGFQNNAMPPEFFAKALAFNGGDKEKQEYRGSGSRNNSNTVRSTTEKGLPAPPAGENPLPPAPAEPKRYALNVNINKSMIFDDAMISAVSSIRDGGTPRERAPRYRFEEYLPPVATTPPISIARAPAKSTRSSVYEMDRYPRKRASVQTATTHSSEDSEDDLASPVEQARSRLQSKAPQLPLPDLPPPSPSLSFQSYDWYQDIIGDQPNGEPPTPTFPPRSPARTPTQATFPATSTLPSRSFLDTSLVPQPLPPAAPPAAAGLHLHPSSAASPTPASPHFHLSPTVYTMPSRQPKLPPMPPSPPAPISARISTLSTMTRATHNSRSWLPDDGLYLAEEGTIDSYKRFRRPSDPSRPTSYSPF